MCIRDSFYSTNASSISIFKNAEDEVVSFGVLPNPKFSESQDKMCIRDRARSGPILRVSMCFGAFICLKEKKT